MVSSTPARTCRPVTTRTRSPRRSCSKFSWKDANVKAARATLGFLLLLGAAPARAGGLNVSPIQINLSPTLTKSLLVLRNDGNEAVRYQVSAHAWSQGPRGEM